LTREDSENPGHSSHEKTHFELRESKGDAVQARNIRGGVHFHKAVEPGYRIPHQLPRDVLSFVNRAPELEQLDHILEDNSGGPHGAALLVITGTAGVGKTSLAVRWARSVRERFPDGQLYINLRGYDPGKPVSPDTALEHFLRAMAVPAGSIPSDLHAKSALFRSIIADQRILIVLDNAATVSQVRPLLPGTATCFVLVTSRSRLPGLVVREDASRVTVDILREDEAVELLLEVTARHRTDDDQAELTELAQLCAHLPLALRIAAERAAARPWMPLNELIGDLRDESALWDALSSADDDEADAVRTVFAWSYRALQEDVARLFRLLGLHPGAEFCLSAAAAISGLTRNRVRYLVEALLSAHLLEQTGPDRYQFHDLLRAYAIDQVRNGETDDTQKAALHRVLNWYLHTADTARAAAAPGRHRMPITLDPPDSAITPMRFPTYSEAVDWYDTERSNLLASVSAAAENGFDRIAWQLPAVLAGIYDNRDPVETWFAAEEIALSAARRLSDRYAEAVLLDRQGIKYRKRHQLDNAIQTFTAAVEIFRELDVERGEARSLHNLGLTQLNYNRLPEAEETLNRSLDIAQRLQDNALSGLAHMNLGVAYQDLDRLADSVHHLSAALRIFRDEQDPALEAQVLRELSAAQRELGQLAEANNSIQQALAIARDRNALHFESSILLELAKLQIVSGIATEALVSSQRAAAIARQFNNPTIESRAFDITGLAYQALERYEEAIPFHRHACDMHRDRNDPLRLAEALDHVATALDLAEKPIEAAQRWQEAESALRDVIGPAATALRLRITRKADDSRRQGED
jgi:tetratricopeptide (TPR) repeat protein